MRYGIIWSLGVVIVSGSLLTLSSAQQQTPAAKPAASEKPLEIVPLVVLKPGETKELLLSTWCTVGLTRGGGFGLTEMRDGKPVGGGHAVKTYEQAGVTITAPDFDAATKFAAQAKFAQLQAADVEPFRITIAAAKDARPGLLAMHLVDATCSGHCHTDFRVLVLEE